MIEKFDIANFHECGQEGVYERTLETGVHIMQYEYAEGYVEKITCPNQLFAVHKDFYLNGVIREKGLVFTKGDFPAGLWKSYDAKGEFIKEINYDRGFAFNVEDVLSFMEEREIDLDDTYTDIRRTCEPFVKALWWIDYRATTENSKASLRILTLDGKTGRVLNEESVRL